MTREEAKAAWVDRLVVVEGVPGERYAVTDAFVEQAGNVSLVVRQCGRLVARVGVVTGDRVRVVGRLEPGKEQRPPL